MVSAFAVTKVDARLHVSKAAVMFRKAFLSKEGRDALHRLDARNHFSEQNVASREFWYALAPVQRANGPSSRLVGTAVGVQRENAVRTRWGKALVGMDGRVSPSVAGQRQ